MNILGQRLKKTRESKGLVQKFVAAKLGLSNVALSQYENSIRKPDPETLTNLADIYEVTTDYLLGRTHSKEAFVIKNMDDYDVLSFLDEVDKKNNLLVNVSEEGKGIVLLMLRIMKAICVEDKKISEPVSRFFLAQLESIQQELYR